MGVNSNGELFLPLCWGRGPGSDAGQWVMGQDTGSRNHVIKSYCRAFCRARGGHPGQRRSEDVLRLASEDEEGLLGTQPRWDLSGLTSPVLLSVGKAFPKTLTVCFMHRHPGVPSIPGGAPVFTPRAGAGSPASLAWSGLCHGIRPSPGPSADPREAHRALAPLQGLRE